MPAVRCGVLPWFMGACALVLGACQEGKPADWGVVDQSLIAGRVVGADGLGLPDAEVQVLWKRGPIKTLYILTAPSLYPMRHEQHVFASARSDSAGAFELVLPEWFTKCQPTAWLVVSKEGYSSTDSLFEYSSSPRECVLTRASEGNHTGRLIDEFGAPVAGALVTLVHPFLAVAQTYSDEHGAFSFGSIGNDSDMSIFACRSPSDLGVWSNRLSGAPVVLCMPQGSPRRTSVLDAAGHPLRNEYVTVIETHQGRIRWTEMLTDSEGVVMIDGATEKPIQISCADSSVRVDERDEHAVVLPTIRQFPLEVLDEDTGVGLSDVVIFPPKDTCACAFLGKDTWRSGNNVTFKIGLHDLSFTVDGYEPWRGMVSVDRDTQRLVIRLKKRVSPDVIHTRRRIK